MALKYCPYCKRNVGTESNANIGIFIVLFIFLFIPGIIYYFMKGRRCVICGSPEKAMEAPRINDDRSQ